MDASSIIVWAVCIALFASAMGVDEWLRSLFGASRTRKLEARIAVLEQRLDALSGK
jgi:hypothetical protein